VTKEAESEIVKYRAAKAEYAEHDRMARLARDRMLASYNRLFELYREDWKNLPHDFVWTDL